MKILGVIFLALAFTKCASLPFDANPPFTITKTTYQNWTAGVRGGGGGTNVHISYTSEKEIAFKDLYYKGKKRKISFKKGKNGEKYLMAQFKDPNKNKRNLQVHREANKEFGNKPKEKEIDFPFELQDHEAVLSYKEGDEIKYFKIKNIEQGKRLLLP